MRQPAITLAWAALAVGLGLLARRAGEVAAVAAGALGSPLSLDYGEGIVLQQALLLGTPRAYGDITAYPFLVFHYPPGYLLATRVVALGGLDMALAGRLVSFLSTLLVALGAATLVHAALAGRDRPARLAGAGFAGLALFAFSPVSGWMPVARVDMLAIALTLWGLVVALLGPARPWRLWIAAALFTAAVFTRQTALAAPAAATLVLLLARPRDALHLVAAGLLLATATLGLLVWATGGGFLVHILGYNINRYELRLLVWALHDFGAEHAPLILAGLAGALAVLRGLPARLGAVRAGLAAEPGACARLGILAYAALSTPLLALAAKSGSSLNYFLEWLVGCAMLAGILAGALLAARGGRRPWAAAAGLTALAGLVAAQTVVLPRPMHAEAPYGGITPAQAEALIELARTVPGDVISDDMLVTLRAGKEVPWEPAIFAELASLGRWEERLIVERIRAGQIALAITLGDRGEWMFRARYNPAVADALDEVLPRRVPLGRLMVRLPAESAWQPP